MEKYRIIIAGNRKFDDYAFMKKVLDMLLKNKKQLIFVVGKARGADNLGERYARENDIEVEEYPADWDKLGKSAGYIRNTEMAHVSNALVAFQDGPSGSKGTNHMVDISYKKGLEVREIDYRNKRILPQRA